ncbi:hypothetical protein [Magnetospirillum sp. UT-4]|uniref:DUF6967 family protein n=1 Tax=Magnetospirillum sp. UT-4 TaxID=2681467 RepID=UPI0013856AE0|nr:hypothetical protein [Magnetospirillum sp. UT-4]CAA7620808.1 conserved hypothetical protein [Magnetospirillum sp. UT-4]
MTTEPPKFAEETITPLTVIEAPWSREVTLSAVDHESGLKLMRVRIKEGRARFTILDIDVPTARAWAQAMTDWADKAEGK